MPATTVGFDSAWRAVANGPPARKGVGQMNQAIDSAKLDQFLGHVVGDLGAAMNAALVRVGDKLGLYKGLAAGGAQTPGELAQRTGTQERYVREWLCAQAAGGYLVYDAKNGRFSLSPEQGAALADETSPAYMP